MLYNADTKVGKYWDYPKDKIGDDTPIEIRSIREYQDYLLMKKREWTEDDYRAFSSMIKQFRLSDFVNFITLHKEILNLSLEEMLAEINNLSEKKILLLKPENGSEYSMIAIMAVEIQRRVKQFSTYTIFKCGVDPNGSIEKKIAGYQQVLEELQSTDSHYRQFILSFFNEWVNQTFQSNSLKKSILTMQDYILTANIKYLRKRIKKEYANLAWANNEISRYYYSYIKSNV